MARMRSARNRRFMAAMMIVVAGVAIWWSQSAYRTQTAQPTAPPAAGRSVSGPAQAQAEPPRPMIAHELSPPQIQAVAAAATIAPAPAAASATTQPSDATPAPSASLGSPAASASLAEASAALAGGNLVQARKVLSQAVDPVGDSPINDQILQQLVKLGNETIFSTKVVQNDPLVIKHVVEPGQNLQKIANLYKTTVPLICRVNDLASPNTLRQGQPLKVVLGPFHATVCKHNFRMSVYCQDTLVKTFAVGLGAEGTTPTGNWKLKNKLLKPRYYPPRGGKVIEAGDPKNPLGGLWMGLEGVEGQALGQERYGIHGTIEPDSIGKNASLGCIRLRNEDAAFVYELLVVHDSIVTVKD